MAHATNARLLDSLGVAKRNSRTPSGARCRRGELNQIRIGFYHLAWPSTSTACALGWPRADLALVVLSWDLIWHEVRHGSKLPKLRH